MTEQDRSKSDVVVRPPTITTLTVCNLERSRWILWAASDLIPLVRLLAREAAAELFHEAANDNRRSSKTLPKE